MDAVLKEVLLIIGGILVCGGFWTFVQFMISRKDDQKSALKDLQAAVTKLQKSVDVNNSNMDKQNEALKAIAQDRIVWLGKEYIKQGWVYLSDYTVLKRMADAYKVLGGNDLVTEVMKQVNDLPRKVKE